MSEIFEELYNFFRSHQILYGSKRPWNAELGEQTPRIQMAAVRSPQKEQKGKQLPDFYHQIKDCKKCSLGKSRTKFVFGEGNPNSELMFIGEAPGRDEDLQGEPFVGRAGQLLTLMIQAIGMKRHEVYIANVLKCRPPNNRDPLPEEIEQCEPYLMRQIELISPRLIVALGRFASASLLRTKESLGNLRKQLHSYNKVPLLVTYHPAALLRNPQLKQQAWEDLKKIVQILQQ